MSKKEFIEQYCRQRNITPAYFAQHFKATKVAGEWTAKLLSNS